MSVKSCSDVGEISLLEASKQALEALEHLTWAVSHPDNVKIGKDGQATLRTAIEQAGKQEPVKTGDTLLRRFMMEANRAGITHWPTPPAAPVQYPLPDDLYDSKDWKSGSYAERVEWLHTMYESTKKTLDDYTAAPNVATPRVQEPVAWLHEWEDGERIPMLNKREMNDRDPDRPISVRPLVYGDTTPPAAPVQEPDWSNVGRLIEAAHLANGAGHLTGTSNWAAAVCKYMSAAPAAQRQWVGLSEDEINRLRHLVDWTAGWPYGRFAYELEQLLREKNGG